MGTGCLVAKENADLVILNNEFSSIYNSIMWGRTIYENVRKFVQF
jgi:Ca2+-transporting ATPase